jgi:hypothetical protein
MIIESLIKDESKLTLDCAKATLHRGSKVELDDSTYWTKEVQGAIKLGMIRIIGDPPPPMKVQEEGAPEKKIKYKSLHSSKLCFESLKDYVDPGNFIHIPESKIHEREIQNAIAWGMIEPADGPKGVVKTRLTTPVKIDEFTATDTVDSEAPEKEPEETKVLTSEEQVIVKSRAKKKAKPPEVKPDFKPKSISSNTSDDLYAETKVVDHVAKPAKVATKPVAVLIEGDEEESPEVEAPKTGVPRKPKSFGFVDVFAGAQVSKEPEKVAPEASGGEEF